MLDRRTRVLDAAIAIIGDGGLRTLTHRAVDRRLDLPEGSTSNYFRTREALLDAAIDRLLEVDQATLTDIHSGFDTLDDAALSRGIAEFVVRLTRPGRARRTRARFVLTLSQPDRMGVLLGEWVEIAVTHLTAHGVADPQATARAIVAYIDGITLHATLADGGRGVELDRAEIASNVLKLLRDP
jgi:DNA-binding transcriptional regulator YbjK